MPTNLILTDAHLAETPAKSLSLTHAHAADTLTHTQLPTRPHTHTHTHTDLNTHTCGSVLQRVAVCCSVWQCVAVCCSVLQCVAVCCSAACCSALQRVACLACLSPHTNTLPYTHTYPQNASVQHLAHNPFIFPADFSLAVANCNFATPHTHVRAHTCAHTHPHTDAHTRSRTYTYACTHTLQQHCNTLQQHVIDGCHFVSYAAYTRTNTHSL